MKHAIGGALATMPDAMSHLRPQRANAFRRYKANNFVPVSRSWGFENRSAAIRVPIGLATPRRAAPGAGWGWARFGYGSRVYVAPWAGGGFSRRPANAWYLRRLVTPSSERDHGARPPLRPASSR